MRVDQQDKADFVEDEAEQIQLALSIFCKKVQILKGHNAGYSLL